ncbi:MAG: TolB family protein [Armatimonadota bacterium]
MNILRNPEYRGIAILILVIGLMGFVLAVATGRIELFPGPRALDKIIFVSDAGGSPEIFAINADGTGRAQLTAGADVRSTPAVSPKGDRIVCVGRFRGSEQVFSIGAEGGTPDWLTSQSGPKEHPMFTPDGGRISYIASGRVFVANRNGDNPYPILPTTLELRAAMSDPLRRGEVPTYFDYAWAKDSEAIVGARRDTDGSESVLFLAGHDAAPQIVPGVGLTWSRLLNVLLEREGESRHRVAPDARVRITGLAWAAAMDGFAVSLVSGRDGFLLVFVLDKNQLRLGGFKSFEGRKVGRPTFAPDGSAVVVPVAGGKDGAESGLVRVDLAEGQAELICSGAFEKPSYSPAGDRILAVLADEKARKRDLVSVGLDTGEVKRLTRDGHSYDAVWSPPSEADGTR